MSRSSPDQVSRERLFEDGAGFEMPEKAIYFCIDHQVFMENRHDAQKHMKCKGHGLPGSVQCSQCLNWFPNARELTHHVSVAGDTHKLPFPYREVTIMGSGRISGSEEAEPTDEHAVEQGFVDGEIKQMAELPLHSSPVRKKVLPINLSRIQGVLPKKGKLI